MEKNPNFPRLVPMYEMEKNINFPQLVPIYGHCIVKVPLAFLRNFLLHEKRDVQKIKKKYQMAKVYLRFSLMKDDEEE
jgi:hypothetical protein